MTFDDVASGISQLSSLERARAADVDTCRRRSAILGGSLSRRSAFVLTAFGHDIL